MNKPMSFMAAVPEGTRRWDASVMRLNVKTDVILNNIRSSITRQLPQFQPHEESAERVAIVGGGWSLADTADELRDLYFNGTKIVALNGSANWLMERNLKPSIHIVMDARPENLPFVEKPIPRCKYFLASQCDASLFDACVDRDLRIFHVISTEQEEERKILNDFYRERWTQVPGAGTIGIVALLLCRMLGFKYQHVFGVDSCYAPDGRHHSFAQPLNDSEGSAVFWCAGKQFRCSAWQASQAQNFVSVVKHHGDLLQLCIHGDGVLAHLLKSGADVADVFDFGVVDANANLRSA